MPRSVQQNEALRAATRAKLMRAALLLFARDGYAGTSVRSIAAEAGVATGLLYSHFKGKEALLRAIFEESMTQVRASFALADAEATPDARLATLVRSSARIVRDNLDFWRLGYAARTQPSVLQALGPALDSWISSVVLVLRGHLQATGSDAPDLDAMALFAQIDGMCQHFAMHPDRFPVHDVSERIIARWSAPTSLPSSRGTAT